MADMHAKLMAEIKRLHGVIRDRDSEIATLQEAVRELLATHPAAYRDPGSIDNRTDNAVRIARAAVA